MPIDTIYMTFGYTWWYRIAKRLLINKVVARFISQKQMMACLMWLGKKGIRVTCSHEKAHPNPRSPFTARTALYVLLYLLIGAVGFWIGVTR